MSVALYMDVHIRWAITAGLRRTLIDGSRRGLMWKSCAVLGEDRMHRMTLCSTLAALVALAASAGAVDLAKIDRSIRREPVYQSGEPLYCLLVFGPEAKMRVWLVLDGDTLYVDRNGNGDLTEPAERISPKYSLHTSERRDMKIMRGFHLWGKDGRIQGEPVLSAVTDLNVLLVEYVVPSDEREDPLADMFRKRPLRVVAGNLRYGEDSSLAPASRPGDAPIVHFDGPRQLGLHPYSQPLRRGETAWLAIDVRTPGLNAWTRTHSATGMEDFHPVAEIECPPRRPGAHPVRLRLELPGRG